MEPKVRRGIGLVAHDAMKKDLIEWVLWNSELLMGNKFYCTGTTGTLILDTSGCFSFSASRIRVPVVPVQ